MNQSFVRKYFPGGAVLGRRVKVFGGAGMVIGVARDSKYFDVTEAPRPHFFAPYRPQTGQTYSFHQNQPNGRRDVGIAARGHGCGNRGRQRST